MKKEEIQEGLNNNINLRSVSGEVGASWGCD
jgi:hypothetical protein